MMWIWILLLLLCVVAAGAAVLVYMYYRCPQKLLFLLLPWMQRAYFLYTKLQSLRPSREHSSIRRPPGSPARAGGKGKNALFFGGDASEREKLARIHQHPQQKHNYTSVLQSEQHRSRSQWDNQVPTKAYLSEGKKQKDVSATSRRIDELGNYCGDDSCMRDNRCLKNRRGWQQQHQKQHLSKNQDEEKNDWIDESEESEKDSTRHITTEHNNYGRNALHSPTTASTAAAAARVQKDSSAAMLRPTAPGGAPVVSLTEGERSEEAALAAHGERRGKLPQSVGERENGARDEHDAAKRGAPHAGGVEAEKTSSFPAVSLSPSLKEEEENNSKNGERRDIIYPGKSCITLSSSLRTSGAVVKSISAETEVATAAGAMKTAAAPDDGDETSKNASEKTLSEKEEGSDVHGGICLSEREVGTTADIQVAVDLSDDATTEGGREKESAVSIDMQSKHTPVLPLLERRVSHDEGTSPQASSTAAVSAADADLSSEEATPAPVAATAPSTETAATAGAFAFPVAAAAKAAAEAEAAAVGAPRSVQQLLQEEKEQQEMQGDDEREEDDISQKEDDGGEEFEKNGTFGRKETPDYREKLFTASISSTVDSAAREEERTVTQDEKRRSSAGLMDFEKAKGDGGENTEMISSNDVPVYAEGRIIQRREGLKEEVQHDTEKAEQGSSSADGFFREKHKEGDKREGDVNSSVSQSSRTEEQEKGRQDEGKEVMEKRQETKKEEDGRSSSEEEEDATAAELKEKGNRKFRAASYNSAVEYYTLALDRLDEEEDDWLDEWDAVMQEKEEELEAAEALRQKRKKDLQRYRSGSSTVQEEEEENSTSEDEENSEEDAGERKEKTEIAKQREMAAVEITEAQEDGAERQQKEQLSEKKEEKTEGKQGTQQGKKQKKKKEKKNDGLLTEEAFEQFRNTKEKEREIKQQECNNLRAVLLSNRAACHMQSGGWQQVLADCTEAIQCDSSYAKAYLRRYTANQALSKWHDALADINKALELDRSLEGRYRSHQQRVKKMSEQQFEKEKEEMLGKLKDFGNFVLGKVGLSLDNFKVEQNPETGSYNISFQQNAAAASSSTA